MRTANIFKLSLSMLAAVAMTFAGCNNEKLPEGEASLRVSPLTLSFDSDGAPSDEHDGKITITCNREWTLKVEDAAADWIRPDKTEGEGNGVVTIESMPASTKGRSGRISIWIKNDYDARQQEQVVTVTQGEGVLPPAGDIYRETVGSQSVASPWPLANTYTGWQTTGSGASTVTYSNDGNVSIRNSGLASDGYEGASGPNSVFFGTNNPVLYVRNITMPAGATDFNLSFGASYSFRNADGSHNNTFDMSKFTVALSSDGTTWVPLTYTKNDGDSAHPFWVLASADFTLTNPVSSLYIKFAASEVSVFRMDDIVLKAGNGGQEIDLGGVLPGTPNITAVSPTSLTFPKEGNTQTITVTGADLEGITTSGLTAPFTATVSNETATGATVTVTATANTGTTAISQTLTITATGGNTKTVAVTLQGTGGGTSGYTKFAYTDIKADFPEWTKNSYGTQNVSNESTWVTWETDGITFTGAKVCESPDEFGPAIQMQGNATNAANMAKMKNVTPLTGMKAIRIQFYSAAPNFYAPVYAMTIGGTAVTPTETVIDKGTYKTYVHLYNVTSNATDFLIDNNTVGALYISLFEVDLGDGLPPIDGGTVTPGTPTITAVSPTSLNFPKEGGTQTITVTGTDLNGITASGLTAPFTATTNSTANTVSVVAAANTSATAVSQTLTITATGGNSKTITVTVEGTGGGGTGGTTTFNFATLGTASDTPITTVTQDGVTLTFEQGTATQSPRYWTTSGTNPSLLVRMYRDNKLTVSKAGGTVTKIDFAFGQYGVLSAWTGGSYTSPTWTGSAASVTCNSGEAGGLTNTSRAYITSITVTHN